MIQVGPMMKAVNVIWAVPVYAGQVGHVVQTVHCRSVVVEDI